MVNLFYPNEEAKNSKLKNIEYYKQLGFDQGLVCRNHASFRFARGQQ